MKYPYYKVYQYSGGQLFKYGSPASTGMTGHDLDTIKARIRARYPNPEIQFVIVECLSTYISRIVEVFTCSNPSSNYTFQDVCDGKVKFNLQPGYELVCMAGSGCNFTGKRYEVSVRNAEFGEVWWAQAFTEEGALDRVKSAVEMYKA